MPGYSRDVLCGAALLAGMMCTDVSAQQIYPKDVTDFVQSRDDCEELRSNLPDAEPGNDAKIRDVIQDIREQCRGTDQALDRLKKKYAGDPAVLQKLDSYESQTERDPS